jgi:hypothetical protein
MRRQIVSMLMLSSPVFFKTPEICSALQRCLSSPATRAMRSALNRAPLRQCCRPAVA